MHTQIFKISVYFPTCDVHYMVFMAILLSEKEIKFNVMNVYKM